MRLRKALRKIHRWIGLLASLWLLQLAVTGLLLQLADELGFTDRYVTSPAVLNWFSHGHLQQAFDVQSAVVIQLDDRVGLGQQVITVAEPLVAANRLEGHWLLATANTLRWYSDGGEAVMQLDDFDGLPTPVTALHVADEQLMLNSGQQWYQWQADAFAFTPVAFDNPSGAQARQLSREERQRAFAQLLNNRLSIDKVLHGIHSGLKGSVWLNILSALALLYLCVSGIYLFFKKPRSKNK
jgi:uncharacterized iron-regulated membrane protein